MPSSEPLKVTLDPEISAGLILYKDHSYDIPVDTFLNVSDTRGQNLGCGLGMTNRSQAGVIERRYFVNSNSFPQGMNIQNIDYHYLTASTSGGYTSLYDKEEISLNTKFVGGTHISGIPQITGEYSVPLQIIGGTFDYNFNSVTSGTVGEELGSFLTLGQAYIYLPIIVQDAPSATPPTLGGNPILNPAYFGQASTGSSISAVSLHTLPIETGHLSSSSRSIVLEYSLDRAATTNPSNQTYNIFFGGVSVLNSPIILNTNQSSSISLSIKISRTSSSIYKAEHVFSYTLGSNTIVQTTTGIKNISVNSISGTNLILEATNASGSSAPILSSHGPVVLLG